MLAPDTLTQEQFEARFHPVPDADGSLLRESIRPRDAPNARCVWTVVDGADGIRYAIAGRRFVSRAGYLLTREPWSQPDMSAAFGRAPVAAVA